MKIVKAVNNLGRAMRDRYFQIGVAMGVAAQSEMASATTTGSLPWDGPIKTLTNNLTGPVATGISIVAFLAAGAALVFGEELGGIAKKALYVVMGIALIVFGNSFMSDLGITGAVM